MTSSTPTGTDVSSSSQAPTLPERGVHGLGEHPPDPAPGGDDAAAGHARGHEGVGGLLEQAGRGQQQRPEADQRDPALGHPRPHEGRHAPAAEQEGQQEARVAERAEQRPAQPPAHRPHRRALLGRRQRGIEDGQRGHREAGQGDRHDAPRLAQPPVRIALAPLARLEGGRPDGRDGLVGVDGDDRGHQTSKIMGSTTGLRWNRWVTNCRTASRTRAPIASRSDGSSGARSERAAITAARSASSSGSFSLT